MSLAKKFRQLQEQLSDPSLTALTIMLAVLMFVISPLHAAGVLAAHNFRVIIWPSAACRNFRRIWQLGGGDSRLGRR